MCKDVCKTLKEIRGQLYGKLSKLWIFGSLFRAGAPTYKAAFYEFLYIAAWTFIPFIFAAMTFYVVSDKGASKDFYSFWQETYNNGEFLVLTISMLTPVLFMILYDPEDSGTFPHKLPISTMVTIVMLACIALFSLLKAEAVHDKEVVINLSIVFTIIALTLRFLALIYHRLRLAPTNESTLRAPQEQFVADLSAQIQADSARDMTRALEAEMEQPR